MMPSAERTKPNNTHTHNCCWQYVRKLAASCVYNGIVAEPTNISPSLFLTLLRRPGQLHQLALHLLTLEHSSSSSQEHLSSRLSVRSRYLIPFFYFSHLTWQLQLTTGQATVVVAPAMAATTITSTKTNINTGQRAHPPEEQRERTGRASLATGRPISIQSSPSRPGSGSSHSN